MVKYILGSIVFIFFGVAAIGTESQSLSIPFFVIAVLCIIVPLLYRQKRKREYQTWLHRNYSATMQEVDQMTGVQFEEFCAALLEKHGYKVSFTKASGDQGVDLIAVKNGVKYAIQCKRYDNKVGNAPVQQVYAGTKIYGCSVPIVMTNSFFTSGAKRAASVTGVQLWDRNVIIDMHEASAGSDDWRP